MKQKEAIKKIIEDFLKKLCVDYDEVVFLEKDDFQGGDRFMVKTNESGLLIGNDGANIQALNHLIKKIVWKKFKDQIKAGETVNFFIDIDDYQSKNIERISNKALELAEKAVLFRRDIEMPAMSSYERMIAHSALADNPKVFTESTGENGFRRLVIKVK